MEQLNQFKTPIEYPYLKVISSKDDYCSKHNINFTNELLQLPSGRHKWLNCEKCQEEEKAIQSKQQIYQDNINRGLIWDKQQNCWVKKERQTIITAEQKKPLAYID